MKKEYDSAMTIDEVVARIREKTVPWSMRPFKSWQDGFWARRENFDGTLTIEKNISKYTRAAYITLKILPVVQGTHLILKTSAEWKIFCFSSFIWISVSPIMVYHSVKNGGSTGFALFGIIFLPLVFLLYALLSWLEEKELIDFFETDILGIKK